MRLFEGAGNQITSIVAQSQAQATSNNTGYTFASEAKKEYCVIAFTIIIVVGKVKLVG